MKKSALLSITLLLSATPALAQQQKPGNCAVYAEMTAETIARDDRTAGPNRAAAIMSMEKFAEAQTKLADAGMAQSYEQGKAFGYTKERMDEMTMAGINALRAGYHTSTMDKNKIYMDHVVAVNNCALGAKNDTELGQSKAEIVTTLENMMAWSRS